MKNKIYIKQWIELKPYLNQTVTDGYYLKVANEISNSLLSEEGLILSVYLKREEINLLCCFLASYFEDIISGTNIWNTFRNLHTEKYGKKLPFYETDDYYDGEINEQDVAFLIWYFLNTIQEEKFISPYNDFIVKTAGQVMEIFEKEYEYAPENKYLKSFYQIPAGETDYYQVRTLVDNVLFGTWLFFSDTVKELLLSEVEIMEKENDGHLPGYLNENRDMILHTIRTRLLSLKGNEWTAGILGLQHPLSHHLTNLSQRIRGYFFYKGQDEQDVFLEYIATGHSFKLTKKSFEDGDKLTEPGTILFMGMVRWQDEWWFSGVYVKPEFNADLILDEKNSPESRKQVSFLDYETSGAASILKEQLAIFLKFNNGSQIAFMPAKQVKKFIQEYLEFYNASLQLTPEEKEQANQRAKSEGFQRGGNNFDPGLDDLSEQALVFFNPQSGIELAFGVNDAFPLPGNPDFDIKKSGDAVIHLLISDESSAELARFCIRHGKKKLPVLKQGIVKEYLKDIDFLLRFWKKNNYHAQPQIAFTGRNR